jgi:alpha-tubulin suppressor-like RCC1 family protein
MDVSDSGLSNPEGTDLTRLGLIRDVALARTVTCAAQESGGLLCWGDLQGWGLPDRSRCANEYSLTPGGHEPETPVQGLSDVIKLSAGEHAMLALLRDGSVAEWGWDWNLQAIIASPIIHRFEEPVVGLAASKQTRCVLFASGSVGCWGKNRGLEAGAADDMGMVALPPVLQLSQGWDDDYVCALTRDERVFCWGSNAFGQLGDSSAESSLVPVEIQLGVSAL